MCNILHFAIVMKPMSLRIIINRWPWFIWTVWKNPNNPRPVSSNGPKEPQMPMELLVNLNLFGSLNAVILIIQPRYVVNQVTLGDYDYPSKALTFLRAVHSGFLMLNLRNDLLRKKFDGRQNLYVYIDSWYFSTCVVLFYWFVKN